MDIQYGWKCPQCNTVYAPSQQRCGRCSPQTVSGGTFIGYGGTISVSSTWSAPTMTGYGTVIVGPPSKSQAVQAEETVDAWRSKGFNVKTLIAAAMDTLIEDEDDDEEDED